MNSFTIGRDPFEFSNCSFPSTAHHEVQGTAVALLLLNLSLSHRFVWRWFWYLVVEELINGHTDL